MLNKKQKQDIEKIVQDFLDHGGFSRGEDHVQAYYTIPLLKVLGWNGSNTRVNEGQSVKTNKIPDILLSNDSRSTLFVLESKAPLLKPYGLDGFYTDKGKKTTFIEQLRGYCKAEGVYWGLLTDFIEWRIYSVYPEPKGALYHGKKIKICDVEKGISILTDEAWQMFEMLSYSFLNERNGKIDPDPIYLPPTEIIRKDFFEKLRAWRKLIRTYLLEKTEIRDMAQANLETQKILDRLIFMKVCFDKNVIPQNLLSAILSSKRSKYDELKQQFAELNETFDSSLFLPDTCDDVDISNEIIETIIKGLNGIDFSGLSAHVIGEVYEDYLGELLAEERSTASEKKNKKNSGIFYTPESIVGTIVRSTVIPRLEKVKSLEELKEITLLDPACGSGSFLIGAFDAFYNKYREFYKKEKNKPTDFDIKKEVLLNNLHGVDLDDRAVQIARLNLLLKALEGTNQIKGRKLLPDLSINIQCGNSLISGNEDDLKNGFEIELKELIRFKKRFKTAIEDAEKLHYLKKIKQLEGKIESVINKPLKNFFVNIDEKKPFNFRVKFNELFRHGGFDIVVGNPPWGAQLTKEEKLNFKDKFLSGSGIIDTFALFVEKGGDLLNKNGSLGFVLPDIILLKNYPRIRRYLLDNFEINKIIYHGMSFRGVNLNAVTVIVKKNKEQKNHFIDIKIERNDSKIKQNILPQSLFESLEDNKFNIYLTPFLISLKNKLNKEFITLGQLGDAHEGIHSGNIRGKLFIKNKINEKCHKLIFGRDEMNRYYLNWGGMWVNYDKNMIGKNEGEYAGLGKEEHFIKPKILIRRTGDRVLATSDEQGYFASNNLFVFLLNKKYQSKIDLKYLTGLLNSKLLTFFFRLIQPRENQLFAELKINHIKLFPIKVLDKFEQKPIIKLVDKMIACNKRLSKISDKKTAESLEIVEEIKRTDSRIDKLVYSLYNLTQEEIDIVEDRKDAETEYINFMAQFKKLESKKAKIAFTKSISEEELDLVFDGLDKYREDHTLTAEEEEDIREFIVFTKERPPLPHAKHSA